MDKCNYCYDRDCKSCNMKDVTDRMLRPTIRITTKCTQACRHCCFSCSPKKNDMMTVEQAEKVAAFLRKYEISYANIMGGEFFCNPEWKEILNIILREVKVARIVTNGDWAENEEVKEELKDLMTSPLVKTKCVYFCISSDKWHNGKNIDPALEWLRENEIRGNKGAMEDRAVVPIGRGWEYSTFYSSLGCYCRHKETRYSFLIDENGDVYKCPFGLLKIFNVGDTEGNFFERFREVNEKMINVFISSCKTCYMALGK